MKILTLGKDNKGDRMEYKMIWDYHTHTVFSHGKGTIEDNVKVAREKGLKAIAISDHGPGHLTYGIKKSAVGEMRAEIDRLNSIYDDIEIYLSVEANIVNRDRWLDVLPEEIDDYDFILAGYHYGVRNGFCIANYLYDHNIGKSVKREKVLRDRNTEMVVNAVRNNRIKILTHPGDKAPVDMAEVAKACADCGVLMEISTHHSHLTVEEIKICAKEDVKFVISSDAHIPHRVGTFQGGIDRAVEAGLDLSRIVNIEPCGSR